MPIILQKAVKMITYYTILQTLFTALGSYGSSFTHSIAEKVSH